MQCSKQLRVGAVARVSAAGLVTDGAASGAARPTARAVARIAAAEVPIGVDLTYNNTAFWAAYVNCESQYTKQMHIKLLGPDIAGASAEHSEPADRGARQRGREGDRQPRDGDQHGAGDHIRQHASGKF